MCDTLPGWIGRLDAEKKAEYDAWRYELERRRQALLQVANDPYYSYDERKKALEELERL